MEDHTLNVGLPCEAARASDSSDWVESPAERDTEITVIINIMARSFTMLYNVSRSYHKELNLRVLFLIHDHSA